MHTNLNNEVARLLDKVLQKLTAPITIREWIERLEIEAVAEGYIWTHYDLAHTDGNAMPRYKVRARVLLNDWAKKSILDKIGYGLYGPTGAIENLEDDEPVDEDGEELAVDGYIYAYMLPSIAGKLKIGRALDWEKRMVQHAANYSKIGAPERPQVVAVWNVPHHQAVEDALHALLKLRGKHFDGGAGKEWFSCSVDEVATLMALAIGNKQFNKVSIS